jgi:Recombinase zinc beta ribbon domain
LLARLGVLRCGSCGARLCAMKLPRQNDYPIYRCPSTSDCPRHVTISAVIAETVVSDAVRAALSDAVGRASAMSGVQDAERALEQAQDELDAAVRTFDLAGLADETSAHERLAELRKLRDAARDRVEQLGGHRAAVTVSAAADWDTATLDERRALIRAVVERVTVVPGRGAGRVSVELVGR